MGLLLLLLLLRFWLSEYAPSSLSGSLAFTSNRNYSFKINHFSPSTIDLSISMSVYAQSQRGNTLLLVCTVYRSSSCCIFVFLVSSGASASISINASSDGSSDNGAAGAGEQQQLLETASSSYSVSPDDSINLDVTMVLCDI